MISAQQQVSPLAGTQWPSACNGSPVIPGSVASRISSRTRLQRHRYHRLIKPVCSQAGGKGDNEGDKKGGKKDDQAINKPAGADFSAYWSNKVGMCDGGAWKWCLHALQHAPAPKHTHLDESSMSFKLLWALQCTRLLLSYRMPGTP